MTEVSLLKREVRTLNEQLYNEYKKVKNLTEQVNYLKEKLFMVEAELETLYQRKLNEN
tara:strand:- start:612 stop:785 length:174 start_codon:yes stop_codon:yes gene_type:complete